MKKYFTLLVITFSIATLKVSGQLDMAFISTISVDSKNSAHHLTWTVGNNRGANNFYVERSTKGNDFKTIAVIKATEQYSSESYVFSDTLNSPDKIMYRLRIVSKNHHTFYSRIVLTQSKLVSNPDIRILGNPVKGQLLFTYNPTGAQPAEINIYNVSGKIVFNKKIGNTGNNLITIPLNSEFVPGVYVMEINDNMTSQTAKFVKQ